MTKLYTLFFLCLFSTVYSQSYQYVGELKGQQAAASIVPMNGPLSLAVDSAGNTFVYDTQSYIYLFDQKGNILSKWNLNVMGYVNLKIADMAYSRGKLYVLCNPDVGSSFIFLFDRKGALVEKWIPSVSNLTGIAFDSSNWIYIATNNSIHVFNASKTYVNTLGPQLPNISFFNLSDIAIDKAKGILYVSDKEDLTIKKLNLAGTYLHKWGAFGTGNGQFQRISALTLDDSSNVYVLDEFSNRVQKFDENGNFKWKYGSKGTQSNQLDTPSDIYFSANALYISDSENNRVQKISVSSRALIQQYGTKYRSKGSFHVPISIALDASNHIYVVDSYTNLVQKFTPDLQFSQEWGNYNETYDIRTPYYVETDNKGKVIVFSASSTAKICTFQNNGTFETCQPFQNGSSLALATSNDAYLYVIKSDDYKIQKYDASWNLITEWGGNGIDDGQFTAPQDIAVDNVGNVYVLNSDGTSPRVQKFDKDGKFLLAWGQRGTEVDEFKYPVSIAVDKYNNVYIADHETSTIKKFNDHGIFLTQWGTMGTGEGELKNPLGLEVGSDGKVYVGDENRVQVFAPNIVTGIAENVTTPEEVYLVPNPSHGQVTISTKTGQKVTKTIFYDVTGQKLVEYIGHHLDTKLHGHFIAKIELENGKSFVKWIELLP